jgi:Asp/Glu/hydantoin racemase
MRIMVLQQAPQSPANAELDRATNALMQSYAGPGTQIDYCFPDDHPGAGLFAALAEVDQSTRVQTELPYTVSGPALLRKIVWAEQNGYDAVVVRNAFDPAVESARLAVRIPVIGPCRITMHVAASLSDRIGVTVPFEGYLPWTRRLMVTYRVDHLVTDIRSMQLPGIHGIDRSTVRDHARSQALTVMRQLIDETRAECIVPLGAAVVPSLVDPKDLEETLGVPVLNSNAIAIRFAEVCVALGMAHSRRTYPYAPLDLEAFSAMAL